MKNLLCLAVLIGTLPGHGRAADFAAVTAGSQADLAAALKELAALQQRIGDEKVPLSRQLNELESGVLDGRKELAKRQRERDNQMVDLNVLKADVKRQDDQIKYLGGLLTEYGSAMETRLHVAELARYEAGLRDAAAAGEDAGLAPADRLARQLALVGTALRRVEDLLGGDKFAGSALVEGGVLEEGTFAVFGPVAVFAAKSSGKAGLAVQQLGSAAPVVKDAGEGTADGVRSILAISNGALPLDATGGNAFKLAATRETLTGHLIKGGPTMVPILGLGVLAVIIGILKWFQIAFIRLARPRDLQIILDRLNRGEDAKALEHARSVSGPVGQLLTTAVQHAREKKEYLEEVLYEQMLRVRPRLEAFLPVVALAAATAPLLGLLGTVTGMINTFNMISVYGTGDPKTLSGGISEALITTEYGLIVAIPALLIHAFISRKGKGVLGAMEQLSIAFINGLSEQPDRSQDPGEPDSAPQPTPQPATA